MIGQSFLPEIGHRDACSLAQKRPAKMICLESRLLP
jgi:hypothetical protein